MNNSTPLDPSIPQRIGVIGGGVVGHAVARSYLEWAEVRVHDVVPGRSTHSLADVLECDVVFLCLPTPQQSDGLAPDMGAIAAVAEKLAGSETVLVLKSTVPVGTTQRLRVLHSLPNLVHSPEFLTARCAVMDAHIPARNIVGGPICRGRQVLSRLYQERFPGVPLFTMTSAESEYVKLVVNSFFATKISFFNEARTLADRLDMDWSRVMAGVLSDGRIAHAHTRVPGPSGYYGFSGECLPKDLASFRSHLQRYDLPDSVTAGAAARNVEDRKRGQQ